MRDGEHCQSIEIKKKGESKKSRVEVMAELYNEHKDIAIMVAPEGSRSLSKAMEDRVLLCGLASQRSHWLGLPRLS